MTVKQLLDQIDSRELSEWIAFDRVDVDDSWNQTARICLTIAQSIGDRKSRLEDFLPARRQVDGPAPDLTAKVLAWASSVNARNARPRE